MRRRKFLSLSGSGFLCSTAVMGSNDPVLAVDFTLDAGVNADPSDVSSILVDFTQFTLLPMYVDESAGDASITVKVDITGLDTVTRSIDQKLINGQVITESDLSGVTPLKVDRVPDDVSAVEGDVTVELDHSSVSETYSQSFYLSDDETPVAASDLVAWYPFENGSQDETAGDSTFGDATDYSGSVHNATKLDNGGVTDIIQGVNSTAYDIASGDAAVRYNDDGPSLSSLTVCSWVKISGVNNDYPGIVSVVPSDGIKDYESGFTFQFYEGALDMEARIITNGQGYGSHTPTNSSITVGNGIPRNEWVHVAWTYDSSTGDNAFYVDGEKEITFGGSSGFSINADRLTIGERYYKNQPSGGYQNSLEGQQDDARIYDANLSDSEIQEIYNRTKP